MVEIEKHLKIAWLAYKKNFIPIISSLVIIAVVFVAFMILGIYLLLITSMQSTNLFDLPSNTQPINLSSSAGLKPLFLSYSLGLPLILILLGYLFVIYLSSGFVGLCYYGVKKKVNLPIFFKTIKERGLAYLLTSLIILFLYSLILLPPILILLFLFFESQFLIAKFILELILDTMLIFVTPFIVLYSPALISGEGVMGSIRQSIYLGKRNYLNLLILVILFFVLSFVGGVPYIGMLIELFFILPILQLTICSFYIEKSRKKELK